MEPKELARVDHFTLIRKLQGTNWPVDLKPAIQKTAGTGNGRRNAGGACAAFGGEMDDMEMMGENDIIKSKKQIRQ